MHFRVFTIFARELHMHLFSSSFGTRHLQHRIVALAGDDDSPGSFPPRLVARAENAVQRLHQRLVELARQVEEARAGRQLLEASHARLQADLAHERKRGELIAGYVDGCWETRVAGGGTLPPEATLTPSQNLLALLGRDPASRLDRFLARAHPDERTRLQRFVQASLAEKAARPPAEYRLRLADDEYRWLRIHCDSLVEADGQAVRLICTLRDIDEG
jgi:PAS domain-containing protein